MRATASGGDLLELQRGAEAREVARRVLQQGRLGICSLNCLLYRVRTQIIGS